MTKKPIPGKSDISSVTPTSLPRYPFHVRMPAQFVQKWDEFAFSRGRLKRPYMLRVAIQLLEELPPPRLQDLVNDMRRLRDRETYHPLQDCNTKLPQELIDRLDGFAVYHGRLTRPEILRLSLLVLEALPAAQLQSMIAAARQQRTPGS